MSSSNPPQEGTDTDKTPTPTPSAPPKPFSMSLSSNGTTKKPTSFTLKSSSSATAEPQPRRRGGQPHQHLNHHDSDSDPENDDPTHEAVTGFDTQTGTAISADSSERGKAKELVIPVASGNNWRDRPGVNVNVHGRRRGKKNLLPREVQAIQEAREKGVDVEGGGEEEEGEGKLKFGITYAERSVGVDGEDKETETEMKDANAGPIVPPVIDERRPLTQDEIALRELVKESTGESEGRTDLVIQSKPADEEEEAGDEGEGGGRYDETSSFRADIASRPESSSLDQYNTIPVEEFGAALLRGMGWKEGQAVGRGNYDTSATANRSITAPRIPERRPGFLGIGAKDLSGGKGAESEIGAWGKAAMRKGARKGGKEGGDGNTEGVYMPVMMRNRQTGEYITEEELGAARKEVKGRKKDDDEWKERRDRNLERSGRDRDRGDREYRKRDYENGDDYDRSSRRTGSSRRDRSLSPGDRSSRRRRYDDDDYSSSGRDERRDRERERERGRRDRDRDRSRKYRDDDRYSSRHSSSHSSRHRDRERDRERDRDSDRDSYRRRHDR